MAQVPSTLAVFDFDGTITTRDSLPPFLWHAAGAGGFLARLGPVILQAGGFKLGLVARQTAKERVLANFFQGTERRYLEELGAAFAREKIPALLRPQALARLREHLGNGDRVLLISASIETYLIPWARGIGDIEVLATRLEYDAQQRFTGRFLGKNCYGPEKVARLAAAVPDYKSRRLVVYGDSPGDHDLYAVADKFHDRYF
jgi:HAD superfamily hydrolase (TIGR01490 family)